MVYSDMLSIWGLLSVPRGIKIPDPPGSQPYDGRSQEYPSPVNAFKENEK
jgi:hypothetical protein